MLDFVFHTKEGKMGIFSYLFGTKKPVEKPQLQSILPAQAAQSIQTGSLPVLKSSKLILSCGETCSFVERAANLVKNKYYVGQHKGGTIRVWRGFSLRLGESESRPNYELSYSLGILYFTDKRIVFTSKDNPFEIKLSKLTSVTPYADGLELQCGNKTYAVLLPDGNLAKQALDLLV